MKWLNPKTNKTYGSVLEALVDYMCPGPCIDCQLNLPTRSGEMTRGPHPCLRYTKDNPVDVAKSMGLVQVETLASDMTLAEVQQMCSMRASEFGPDMCVGCVLYGERKEAYREPQLPNGCKLMGRGVSPNNWQLETFITFDPAEQTQLRGLRDAFGDGAIIERTTSGALMLCAPEGKVELPRTWWSALPNDTAFTMVEAQKNNFAGAPVKCTWHRKELPRRMPSPPLKPGGEMTGKFTDERGMLDPQSYAKPSGGQTIKPNEGQDGITNW